MTFFESSMAVNVTKSHAHVKIESDHASVVLKWDNNDAGYEHLDALLYSIPEFMAILEKPREPGDVINIGDSAASLMLMHRESLPDGEL